MQAAEVRPTDRAVVHHIIAYVREPGSNYFKDQKPGVFFEAPPAKTDEKTDTSALPSDFLVGYAPGQPAEILQPGQGKLIKAGSDIVFEVHYTPNGKAVMDQTKLGLVLAREVPKNRVPLQATALSRFARRSRLPRRCDVRSRQAGSLGFASIHTGRTSISIGISQRRDADDSAGAGNWQWRMVQPAGPIVLQGIKIGCTAHFDNSARNPENPDPTKTGSASRLDEMMIGFVSYMT